MYIYILIYTNIVPLVVGINLVDSKLSNYLSQQPCTMLNKNLSNISHPSHFKLVD